jgi:hypothetical protein
MVARLIEKTIGPSFGLELQNHGGLIGHHFTWCATFVEFFGDTPREVEAGVLAVLAKHDPANPNPLDQLQALEAQQTARRLREAAIGADSGWLTNLDKQIAALRAQLKS